MTQLNAGNNYGLKPHDLTETDHQYGDMVDQVDRLRSAFEAVKKELDARPEIPMGALQQVLLALTGAPHEIRELQVTRSIPGNPIDALIDQFNAWVKPAEAAVADPEPPMTLVHADGTETKEPYNPDLLAFSHEGTSIRNPFLSECGRFYANPTYYGFHLVETGGGCQAYHKDLEDGRYLLLTTGDGHLPDEVEDSDDALLGLYAEDGTSIAYITVSDIPDPE